MCILITIFVLTLMVLPTESFAPPPTHIYLHSPISKSPTPHSTLKRPAPTGTTLHAQKLSDLPQGISPFERSLSKSLDVQNTFRTIAKRAVDAAINDGLNLLEIEFPPLIGGDRSKSQFDDFDNIQELDKNRDWTIQFAPFFAASSGRYKGGKTWLIFPDLRECELAKEEWTGGRYRTSTFTTIEAATTFLNNNNEQSYDAPWGANFLSSVSKIMGGKRGDAGLLGNRAALDPLVYGDNAPPTIGFVIQPGNGGPVEDWVNCEKIHDASPDMVMVIVNGALDKVRGGYYPGVFFPKLAATVDRFFNRFESVFYLKPISDKGVYGWLYRVYPEPWQVVLQIVKTKKNDQKYVEDTVVYTSNKRPSYDEVVAKLVAANAKIVG